MTLDDNASHLYFANAFGTIDVVSHPAGKFLGSYTAGTEPTGICPPKRTAVDAGAFHGRGTRDHGGR